MDDDQTEHELVSTLLDDLFPICRSITGPGFRESLEILERHAPLEVEGVPSGTDVFDWTVPPEWHVRDAYLEGPDGERYADFRETNLAVVNYSEPVDRWLSLDELDSHLYSHPTHPDARPYVTSYYERNWGFSLPHTVRESLPDGEYHAVVDSEFVDGELNYAHTVLPGESDEEVLLSTYLCHPSMANNELSGPLTMALLYRRLAAWESRYYTYRFVVCPETIGSITYLHEHGDHLLETLVGGLVLTCLGGPEPGLSYKLSRREDSLLDRTVRYMIECDQLDAELRPFSQVLGSDERQYCSAGFDLPVGQMARTVYEEYPEYHTDKDDKEFMGIDPIVASADGVERVLRNFEYAGRFENLQPYGEPMLSKRHLYPTVNNFLGDESTESYLSEQTRAEYMDASAAEKITALDIDDRTYFSRLLMLLHYSDGDHDVLDIARRCECTLEELMPIVEVLTDKELLARLPTGQ